MGRAYAECDRAVFVSPITEMVIQETPVNHLCMDITRDTQFQTEPAPRNLLLDLVRHMDDMA